MNMRRQLLGFLGLAAAIATTAALAGGQVVQTQTGQALDANYQVGSGGYNRVAGGVGGVNSQLYVTGQVRGLSAFQGHVGYVGASQLRLNLPSASLGTFRQQSVGVQDAYGGGAYRPAPYFERTSTVFGARGITHGFTLPGTSIPSPRAAKPGVTQRLYTDVVADYQSVVSPGLGQRVLSSDISPAARPARAGEEGPSSDRQHSELFVSREADSVFGVLRLQDREKLAREFSETDRQQPEELAAHEVRTEIDTIVQAPVVAPKREGPGSEASTAEEGAERDSSSVLTGRREGGLPGADQDVFLDLLILLRERRQAGEDTVPGAEALREQGYGTEETEPPSAA
ncbi:MAG: hypothetical protein KAU28_08855, partial [Phycisphaerae bacterium]|nr:hypothetical protein [Phycisphaerae bacterium]